MPDVALSATLFWAANLVSLVGFCVHTIAGQRLVMTPLMANEHLELQQKWFHFVAWHGVSISFLAYMVAFAYAALIPGGLDVAIFMTAMNAAIALMFTGVGIKGDPMVFKFPGIYLAVGTTTLGGAGVLVSQKRCRSLIKACTRSVRSRRVPGSWRGLHRASAGRARQHQAANAGSSGSG